DTTTMGVEAARLVRRSAPEAPSPDALWFATASPAYLDKNNASAIHAALRLAPEVAAFDFGGALRSGPGALSAALGGAGTTLVVTSDMRDGLPGGSDEAQGGDGAAAVLIGDDGEASPVIAECIGRAGVTEEFIERWRTPGARRSRAWEERFGEVKYAPLAAQAWKIALGEAGIGPEQVDRLIVTGMHARAVRGITARLGATNAVTVDDLAATVGNTGTAHPALLLASALETAEPGQVIALVVLADGVDVIVVRATPAIAGFRPARTVATQIGNGAPLPYGKFLSWRGAVTLEPPRRPEPDRISASVAGRTEEWKYSFTGSRDRASGELHLPPARVSRVGDTVDDMAPAPMSEVEGTIALFTIDRIAYSPSPPIAFAVVDFDGGGRHPVELTDVDVDRLETGGRIEMTFRKLFTSDEIHNYFWKARPVREAS
ncbi:MAG: OB-fold domain-containing protein, partial [Actinomycetota bacterium]